MPSGFADPDDDADRPDKVKKDSVYKDHEEEELLNKKAEPKSSANRVDPLKAAEAKLLEHLKTNVILNQHKPNPEKPKEKNFHHKLSHLFNNGDLNEWRFYRLDTFDLYNHTIVMSYFITVKADFSDLKEFKMSVYKVLRSRLPEEKVIKQWFGTRSCHDEIEMVL